MSVTRSLLAAALISAAFTGVAFARNDVFTVKFEAPTQETRVITQNTLWSCEGDTCVARPNHAATVRACRQLAHEVGGRVVSYGPAGGELTADEISRCNRDSATLEARN